MPAIYKYVFVGPGSRPPLCGASGKKLEAAGTTVELQ